GSAAVAAALARRRVRVARAGGSSAIGTDAPDSSVTDASAGIATGSAVLRARRLVARAGGSPPSGWTDGCASSGPAAAPAVAGSPPGAAGGPAGGVVASVARRREGRAGASSARAAALPSAPADADRSSGVVADLVSASLAGLAPTGGADLSVTPGSFSSIRTFSSSGGPRARTYAATQGSPCYRRSARNPGKPPKSDDFVRATKSR